MSEARKGYIFMKRIIFFISIVLLSYNFISADAMKDESNNLSEYTLVDTSVEEVYLKVKSLLRNYRGETSTLNEADRLIRELLKTSPNSAHAYVLKALITERKGFVHSKKYKKGYLEKAHEFIETAINIDPEFYDAYYEGVFLYISVGGNLEEAKRLSIRLKELSPESSKTNVALSSIAIEDGNYDEAVRRANIVTSISDDKILLRRAYYSLIKAYKNQKKYDLANSIYIKEIEMYPNDPWLIDAYANFLIYYIKDYDKAIEYGERALSIKNFGMAKMHLGTAYYKKAADLLWKRYLYKIAADNFLTSIKYSPTANAYYGLGIAYWYVGSSLRRPEYFSMAEDALQKSLELKPNHKLAKQQLKNLQKMLKKGRR